MKREKVRRQIRRATAAAAALMLAAAFSLPAGTEIMGVRLGNAIVASAATVDSGDFGATNNLHWELDDNGKLTISGSGAIPDYVPYGGDVVPWKNYKSAITTVYIVNGVTSIGNYAFYQCRSLESVTIPNSVTSIGKFAFGFCSSLESITIPNSVLSIKSHAFENCSELTSVTFAENSELTSIGEYAFSGTSLESITIPKEVTSIGSGAFDDCSRLTSIEVDADNSVCSSIDGVLFTKDINTLLAYPNAKGDSYVIPEGVAAIGEKAFCGCTSLASITIPNSVTSIGGAAFLQCASLTSITIPDSVESIGDAAFSGCTSLASITIPDGVTSIEQSTFGSCTSLTSITIPDSVESIGDMAFYNCTSLTSITIPDSVESIGYMAFADCTSLESITIPDSVESIGDMAFFECTSLESVFLPEGLSNIGYDAIPSETTQVRYTVDDDGNATITKIDLGSDQTKVDLPEKIGEYPITSVAADYLDSVGTHTCAGGTATCTEKAVCGICGQEYADTLGHAYGEPVFNWAEDNSCTATFTCANDSAHVEEINCEVTVKASTEAVCEKGGSVTYTAKVTMGNTEYTEEKTATVPAKGHTIVKAEKTESTCTEDGNTEYYKCSVCGKLFSDSEGSNEISAEDMVIPAKGHNFKNGVCTACGVTDPEHESVPVPVVDHPVVINGDVTVNKPSAAAGEVVNVKTSFGYDIIVTAANGRRIAQITESGSFIMPDSKVYITVVQNEMLGYMSNAWNHSYVYSYDSDMNRIKISSDTKRGVMVIDLGSDYAGKAFTIYSGRNSTKSEVTSGTLDENGRFVFKFDEVRNYTLKIK